MPTAYFALSIYLAFDGLRSVEREQQIVRIFDGSILTSPWRASTRLVSTDLNINL